ncbi:hypothetical protein PT502_08220 [Aliarcobacter butzleri]|uniref:hypothetical protein n=1 Tax=Aliarcobacter butzleri TaxID=28197 RepID=UPI0024DED131|nr:hypothetical protein [Aliarcobacter butzleri]MDK2083787.1 hypothetical protein [Aliarcobacter butzleri]
MPFIIGILVVLLTIGWYLEKFLIKKNWSNPFLNTFYIFNMIFSSPFNIMFAVFILHYSFEYNILNIFDKFSIIFFGITNIYTISLFIGLCTIFSLLIYIIWIFYKGLGISYQSLVDHSKIFVFRIPLLIITCGFFKPSSDAGTEWTIPFLSYLIMMNGLYVVPIFMLYINKINFRIKNN